MQITHAKQCVLAVDTGGTKCEAALVRDDGKILGWGRCDRSDPESSTSTFGIGRSERTVSTAVTRAIDGVECEEIHAVGRLYPTILEALRERCGGNITALPVGEAQPSLAIAGVDAGVVVLAGTGAFVYARTHDRRELLLDGLGPDLGDYGSAYSIGLCGLRAAARSGWGPRHQTSLTEPIYRACKGRPDDTNGWSLWKFMSQGLDRSDIAAFAGIVDAEAQAGDPIAVSIISEAASAIAETVRDLVDRLDLAREHYPMIGAGGVATHSTRYWQQVCEIVHQFAPGLEPQLCDKPQVLGLALIALRKLAPENIDTIRRNLFESARELSK